MRTLGCLCPNPPLPRGWGLGCRQRGWCHQLGPRHRGLGASFPPCLLVDELRFSFGGWLVPAGEDALLGHGLGAACSVCSAPRSAPAPGTDPRAGGDRCAGRTGVSGLDSSAVGWITPLGPTRPSSPWASVSDGKVPAGSALLRPPLKIRSETKTRVCFHFPPLLSVIAQKASI